MLGKQITVCTIAGFAIKVHASWLIIAALVTWSLAEGYFRQYDANLSATTRWVMGIAGAMGLFISVVLHELSHSLVARRYGLDMKGITLFIFGGMAEMAEEPPNARAEFMMAIAGPLASVGIGFGFYAMAAMGGMANVVPSVLLVFGWLGLVNLVLAVFNMIPGYPLDGGRVLRSALWAWKGNLTWATRISSVIGSTFGIALIALGVLEAIYGYLVSGFWMFLIGMFIRFAAKQGYQQVLVRQTLHGEPVHRLMNPSPVTVPAGVTVQQLVDDYVYKYHYHLFPVMNEGQLVGCVDTRRLRDVPKDQWGQLTVGQVLDPSCEHYIIESHEDAMQALTRMTSQDVSRLMVVDDGRLAGMLTLKDLTKFMALKMELEGQDAPSGHLPRPT